jgi:hypothetical protein
MPGKTPEQFAEELQFRMSLETAQLYVGADNSSIIAMIPTSGSLSSAHCLWMVW